MHQGKWIEFQHAKGEFYNDSQGGPAAVLASNECIVTLTAQPANELEALEKEMTAFGSRVHDE